MKKAILFVIISLTQLYSQIKLGPELQSLILKNSPKYLNTINSSQEKHGVIIYTDDPEHLSSLGIKVNTAAPGFTTAYLTLQEINSLTSNDEIKFITTGEMNYNHNDLASSSTGASLLKSGLINNTFYDGRDVLVCIIDTGLDWSHPAFRDPSDQSKSRIAAIWDQTLTRLENEYAPALFDYGVEYLREDIEKELDGSPEGYIRQTDINGHGTHVAGTIAGNGISGNYTGIAPAADILVVKAGNGSFPSFNIIDALTWAKNKAELLCKPIVVNLSLGSDAGPHDGTDPKSAAINDFTGNGRVVVTSAGNSGNSNIHTSGDIPPYSSAAVSIEIPQFLPNKGAGNDNIYLDTWFNSNTDVSITVSTPNSYTTSVSAGSQSTYGSPDGTIYCYNNIAVQNYDRQIYLCVYDSDEQNLPRAGKWEITFTNTSGSSVKFHSWLYDACIGNSTAHLTNGDNEYSLGNTASEAIITGSYVHRWKWTIPNGNSYWSETIDRTGNISLFSGKGPTRNHLQKPDIAAPGQALISCSSNNAKYNESRIISDLYVMNQGTSMSSAVVSGAAALLLQQNSRLSAKEIKQLLTSTAASDSYSGNSLPDNSWGYGKLNIEKAMIRQLKQTAASVNDGGRLYYELAQNYPNPFTSVTTISYTVPVSCNMALKMYDVLGKEIMIIESGYKPAGYYQVEINGNNIPGGVYFYELIAGDYRAVKKLLLLK